MRVDQSQKDIIAALEQMGATVEVIRSLKAGCPDLLVGYWGINFLVECKTPKTGRLSDAQKEWATRWRGDPPKVLKTVDDTIAFVREVQKAATTAGVNR